jgi:hypothetical protein
MRQGHRSIRLPCPRLEIHMDRQTAHHSFRFSSEQWARLEALAATTNSVATYGIRARLPTVATMFARIADGELVIVERVPWSLPDGLAEQAEAVEAQQREQERIIEQQRRVEAHTVQKQAVRKTPVKLVQLDMLTELEPA